MNLLTLFGKRNEHLWRNQLVVFVPSHQNFSANKPSLCIHNGLIQLMNLMAIQSQLQIRHQRDLMIRLGQPVFRTENICQDGAIEFTGFFFRSIRSSASGRPQQCPCGMGRRRTKRSMDTCSLQGRIKRCSNNTSMLAAERTSVNSSPPRRKGLSSSRHMD